MAEFEDILTRLEHVFNATIFSSYLILPIFSMERNDMNKNRYT
ncbi:MAG: hypothetical protein ACTSYC_05040 [Promethearchaeota archaeon]